MLPYRPTVRRYHSHLNTGIDSIRGMSNILRRPLSGLTWSYCGYFYDYSAGESHSVEEISTRMLSVFQAGSQSCSVSVGSLLTIPTLCQFTKVMTHLIGLLPIHYYFIIHADPAVNIFYLQLLVHCRCHAAVYSWVIVLSIIFRHNCPSVYWRVRVISIYD